MNMYKKHIKTRKKTPKNQLKPIKTKIHWFFQLLVTKPDFLAFSGKTEKTTNPALKRSQIRKRTPALPKEPSWNTKKGASSAMFVNL